MPKEYLFSDEHFQDSVNDHYDRIEYMERQQQKDIENQIRNQPMPNQLFTPDQKLMALSWKQPYAELMLHGKIETRAWNTKYRGWVLICASQRGYNFPQMDKISGYQTNRIFATIDIWKYKHGKAIGIGRLVDSRPMEQSDEDKCFVEYYPDLYCHVYEDVQAIVPFDWKGSQGWKEVSEDIKKSIKVRP